MSTLIQNGIEFSNLNMQGALLIPGKVTTSSAAKTAAGKGTPAVDAVNIDWNGAVVDENVVINTSGELISWIKNKL